MPTTTTKRVADTGLPALGDTGLVSRRVGDTGLPSLAVSATKRVAAADADDLLLETGDYLLLEDGTSDLCLEPVVFNYTLNVTKRVADTGLPGL